MSQVQKPFLERTLGSQLRTLSLRLFVFVAISSFFIVTLTGVSLYTRGRASAATNTTLNFQGRLLSNTGNLVADGNYNMEFKLYYATGGALWTDTRYDQNGVTAGLDYRIVIKNGFYSVNL